MTADRLAQLHFEELGDDAVVVSISGEVDDSNAAELRRAVAARLSPGARLLIVDLSDTAYLDSTGVELVFELARQLAARRQELGIVAPAATGVRRVLELCDISSVARLVEDRAELVARRDGG